MYTIYKRVTQISLIMMMSLSMGMSRSDIAIVEPVEPPIIEIPEDMGGDLPPYELIVEMPTIVEEPKKNIFNSLNYAINAIKMINTKNIKINKVKEFYFTPHSKSSPIMMPIASNLSEVEKNKIRQVYIEDEEEFIQERKVLSKKCIDDEEVLNLIYAKIKIAYILKFLKMSSKDNITRYTSTLLILANNKDNKAFSPNEYAKDIIHDLDLGLFVDKLLEYHTKITNIPNWKKKFKSMDLEDIDISKIFYDNGFLIPSNMCYHAYIHFSANDKFYLSESITTLDSWLYSFWWRRYQEGNMEFTKSLLDWVQMMKNQK